MLYNKNIFLTEFKLNSDVLFIIALWKLKPLFSVTSCAVIKVILLYFLRHIMDTWTRQMGYPVLTVKPGDEPNSYFVIQSRFLYDSDAVYTNDSKYK